MFGISSPAVCHRQHGTRLVILRGRGLSSWHVITLQQSPVHRQFFQKPDRRQNYVKDSVFACPVMNAATSRASAFAKALRRSRTAGSLPQISTTVIVTTLQMLAELCHRWRWSVNHQFPQSRGSCCSRPVTFTFNHCSLLPPSVVKRWRSVFRHVVDIGYLHFRTESPSARRHLSHIRQCLQRHRFLQDRKMLEFFHGSGKWLEIIACICRQQSRPVLRHGPADSRMRRVHEPSVVTLG